MLDEIFSVGAKRFAAPQRRAAGVLVVAALVLAGLVFGAAKPSKPVDLTLSSQGGAKVHLKDLRGKIVVLNFWATWCGPCNEEMPMLVATEEEYRARGVVFVGASLDDAKTKAGIPAFLEKYKVSYLVWTGATGDDLAKLELGEAVPATAFLDANGRIVARVSGQIRREEVKERLDWLLSDQTQPAPKAFVSHLENKR